MGMWVVMAGPRVRVVMDMGLELAMVKVRGLYRDPTGMWVEMAGPRVRVVMDLGLELGMKHVLYFAVSLLFAVVADITKKGCSCTGNFFI